MIRTTLLASALLLPPLVQALSPDGNRPSELVGRAVATLFNDGDMAAADRLFAPGMAQEERTFTIALRQSFPDLKLTIDQTVEQGPWVAVRWTARGTHAAAFAGIAATGRQVTWSGAWFWKVNEGRIVDGKQFNVWDRASLIEQLTQVPGAKL